MAIGALHASVEHFAQYYERFGFFRVPIISTILPLAKSFWSTNLELSDSAQLPRRVTEVSDALCEKLTWLHSFVASECSGVCLHP